jgi:molybdopterin synthase catalytic subunit
MFIISSQPIQTTIYSTELQQAEAGALVTFEGWVRNHNEGQCVEALEYECYERMAQKEAEKIILSVMKHFDILNFKAVHRVGRLLVGDLAVWIGVTSKHRHQAFQACEYLIDEIKTCLPIWKKEFYSNGNSGWVNCYQCAHSSKTRLKLHSH